MSDDSFSLFFSPVDKRVFEYISSNPGSYLMDIVNNMDLSASSAFSCLKRLQDVDIVDKMDFKGKVIYYPKGLRSDDVEKAFSQLKHEKRKEIFLHVLDNLGCRQKHVTDEFRGTSRRQVIRHLRALVDAELLRLDRDERSVRYELGRVGKEVVLGSFERIDPFLQSLREKAGDVFMRMEGEGKIIIDMFNGDSITIELGKWKIMDIDEETIYNNRYALLGEGGEQVLIAIYNGSTGVDAICLITSLPEKVVIAKVRSMAIMGLIGNFSLEKDLSLTSSGTRVVEKILKMD